MNPESATVLHLDFSQGSFHARIPVGPDEGSDEGSGGTGLRAGISLLEAGDMRLSGAKELPWRAGFFARMGWPEEKVFAVRQTHSRRLFFIDHGMKGNEAAAREADGLLSARGTGAVLTVTVADCLPVFIRDASSGAYALVHSGWKGTGIARDAVLEMARRFQTRPADVSVTIGPGIGPCCYRVPEDRWRAFRRTFGEAAAPRAEDGAPVLDLARANEALLRQAGVSRIAFVADCTCCSARLGSFRRQGQAFTRMLAFLAPVSSFASAPAPGRQPPVARTRPTDGPRGSDPSWPAPGAC